MSKKKERERMNYIYKQIEEAIELYRKASLVMSIANFNERAIKVY
ncbi:hypothetical protein [Bacillus sp. Cs-700]|nr:hypothetical protein [Bacillus sp. Cs-700]